jgi:hypothetical protein
MGKLAIAQRLADEIGVSLSKARSFVDDVGGSRAQRVLDEMDGATDELGRFLNPTTLTVGGVVGGGALLWRQQDVAEARSLADRAERYNDAVRRIAESNLPADLKQELTDDLTEQAENRNQGGGGGDGFDLSGLVDDPMMMVFALVIVVVVLQTVLGGDR